MADEAQVAPVRDRDGVPIFALGVTMAGAVSAGAYTAGVLDYLTRALEAHERARRAGKVRHRVVLKVMSGASAGGVSAALAVASLIRGMESRAHVHHAVAWDPLDAPAPEKATEGQPYSAALGPLHDIWVDRLRLYDGADGGLLGLRDLKAEPAALLSALNSEALDEAADAALEGVSWAGPTRAWIAEPLELFLTTTNVNGAPYEVTFGGETSGHRMANHAHARHFRVTGLGSTAVGSHWLDVWRDAGIALALPPAPDPDAPFDPAAGAIDFGRPEHTGKPRTAWTEFRETGVATGAFPVGLAARFIRARMDEYAPAAGMEAAQGGAWPLDIDPARRPRPEWGEAGAAGDATYVAVDGGVCNNEPFEYARFTLREALETDDPTRQWRLADNPRGPSDANRAVLMIDPFPEGPQFRLADPANIVERAVAAILGPLLGALIAQARLKPEELVAAADEAVFSRFMVAPSREQAGPDGETEKVRGADAIACGGLGGFSGFFDEAFRRHDFILGQHNCQSFLRRHFLLAADNPVFDAPDGQAGDWRPVLHPTDDPEIRQPDWPRMPPARRDEVRRRIGLRLDAVFDRALGGAVGVGIARWFIRRVWANGLREVAHDAISRRVEAALVARDQMLLALPKKADTPLGRRVVGVLIGPGPHLRSVRGVAATLAAAKAGAAGRRPAQPDRALIDGVAAVFAALRTPEAPERYRLERYGSRVSPADRRPHDLFHLVGRGPGLLRRLTPGMEITDDLGA